MWLWFLFYLKLTKLAKKRRLCESRSLLEYLWPNEIYLKEFFPKNSFYDILWHCPLDSRIIVAVAVKFAKKDLLVFNYTWNKNHEKLLILNSGAPISYAIPAELNTHCENILHKNEVSFTLPKFCFSYKQPRSTRSLHSETRTISHRTSFSALVSRSRRTKTYNLFVFTRKGKKFALLFKTNQLLFAISDGCSPDSERCSGCS